MRQSSIKPSRRINPPWRLNALFVLVGVAALLQLTGCAALISGYDSEFQCPETNKGKCVSVPDAYRESVETNPLVRESVEPKAGSAGQQETATPDSQYSYQKALYEKLTSMISKPATPLVVPPEVMRVLILSYTGADNELFSYRYIYFFATEPRWVISTSKEVE